jgi:hypothetical protein
VDRGFSCMTVSREAGTRTPSAGSQNRSANPYTTSRWLLETAPWRWPESNRLRQRLQGAPATLAVTPAGQASANLPRLALCVVLTLWTCQLSSLYERLCGTVNSALGKTKTAPREFPWGGCRQVPARAYPATTPPVMAARSRDAGFMYPSRFGAWRVVIYPG